MSSSLTDVIAQLNPAQKDAVHHVNGPLIVIAGAGSGKTRVITTRIMYLINEHNVHPSSILALTFTNKAADEMKHRIKQFLGFDQQLPFVGTFHAYCVHLLKRHSALIDLPTFSIIDADDQRKIVQSILKRANLTKQLTPRIALYHISQAKNKSENPEKAIAFEHPLMHEIYLAYEQEKKESNCLDFDDLLIKARLLFDIPHVKIQHQQNIRHILVDEYQDTNIVQHQLLKSMALQDTNKLAIDSLCAVGDEDQSIYSWRGANVTNMLNFPTDFAGTTHVKIEQNYRSVQPILELANNIIQHNTQRTHKELWSEKPSSKQCIQLLSCLSEYTEAQIVAQGVSLLKQKESHPSVAVLYRTHVQSRALEEALIKNGIPYKIVGGIQFYERKEIKDMLAYLRLIKNPFDRPSFFRIINTPARGLGTKFEEQFYERWHREPFLDFAQIIERLAEDGSTKGVKQLALTSFVNLFEDLTPEMPCTDALNTLIARTQYIPFIKNSYEPNEAQERIDNLKELLDATAHFEQQGAGSVAHFLDEVSLLQDQIARSNDEQDVVYLMTLHAVKGLEFDTVFISGLEDTILPSARSINDDTALEEERRLFYVGITRACKRLLLTHCKYRYTYGQMNHYMQSRFLDEIPGAITRSDSTYWKQTEQQQFFKKWFNEKNNDDISSPVKKKYEAKPAVNNHATPSARAPRFRKFQPARHPKYGTGIVQSLEEKSDGTVYVTVKFKTGTKKIVATFLQPV